MSISDFLPLPPKNQGIDRDQLTVLSRSDEYSK
jgi:hypothetical protein